MRSRTILLIVVPVVLVVVFVWMLRALGDSRTSASRVAPADSDAVANKAKYLYVSPSSPAVLPAGYEPLYPVSRNHKYGFISGDGRVVIKPQFDEIGEMSEGLLPVGTGITYDSEFHVAVKPGKWGYLGEDGGYAIEPQFAWASDFSEGLASVTPEGATASGCIDHTGRLVIPAQYGHIWDFSEGIAWAGKGELSGAIDRQGNEVLPYKYELCAIHGTPNYWFKEGLTFVQEGSWHEAGPVSRYFVDKEGKRALPGVEVGDAASFDHGVCFASESRGGLWGLINRKGEWVVRPRYDSCYAFAPGMTEIVDYHSFNETAGFCPGSRTKRWVGFPGYTHGKCVYTFSEGLALVEKAGQFGFIDDRGNEVIIPQYEEAAFFVEGLAKVRVRGKYGYIDKQNNIVINPQYDDASDFQEGVAYVKVRGKYGFIDKSGKMVIPPRFREVGQFKYGLAPIYQGKKWGYIGRGGKVVWRPSI